MRHRPQASASVRHRRGVPPMTTPPLRWYRDRLKPGAIPPQPPNGFDAGPVRGPVVLGEEGLCDSRGVPLTRIWYTNAVDPATPEPERQRFRGAEALDLVRHDLATMKSFPVRPKRPRLDYRNLAAWLAVIALCALVWLWGVPRAFSWLVLAR
jgi:hypothetical protein